MIEIDHNPHEKRPTNTIWWAAWSIVVLLWIWYFAYREFDKDSLALGGITGMLLATWAIETTGNKAPDWLYPRAKKRKRYLPDPVPGEPMTGRNGKALLLVIPAFIALTVALIWLT